MKIRRPGRLAAVIALILTVAACGAGSGSQETAGEPTTGDTTAGETAAAEPTATATPEQEPTTVRFGYNSDFQGASMIAVAEAQGLWEEHGLEVQAEQFTSGPLQIQALGAGDLDFGYIGPGAFWLPASGQAQIVAINTVGLGDRLLAQPGQGIETAADLAGKRVGVPEGTSGDMILQLALEEAGLADSDIEKIAMDPSTVVSAFSSGQIDAAGIWYPLVGTIREQVPDLVEVAKSEDFYPDISFPGAFVTSGELVERDPELVQRVLRVIQEANDYRAENLEEAVQATSELIQVPAEQLQADADNVVYLTTDELVAATEDQTVDGWLNQLQELFVEFGKLPAVVDPQEFYRGDLYVEAAQEG